MGVCPAWPGHRPINADAREEYTMNPEMCEEVATLRDQQLVARGLHEPFVASVLPQLAGPPAARIVLKQQLGALLVRVRVRFQGVHVGAGPRPVPGAVGEWGASASSHEPMYWLSPCRLP
jgi:hypothetical protein